MAMGRPRAFDVNGALDRALEVFWRKGYEGASIADLTRAMGINPPSLYAAFGNKEALFRKALQRYVDEKRAFLEEAMAAPTAAEVVARLLRGSADMLADPDHPRGCLTVQGALTCSEGADPIREELACRRADGEAALRRRLERAQADGDLAPGADCAALARYVATIVQGMSVQAAGGATRAELQAVVDTALLAWSAMGGAVRSRRRPSRPAAPSR